MKPNEFELEQAGQAMVALMDIDYSQEQFDYIVQFLKGHALDLNDMKMAKIFSNQLHGIDAIRTLHDFACQFQNEEDLFEEFEIQLDNIAASILPSEQIGGVSV